MIRQIQILILTSLALTAFLVQSPGQIAAADIPRAEPGNLDLVYQVSANDRQLGRIEIRLSHDENSHRFDAITHPEGLARIFIKEIEESFSFTPTESGWSPNNYSERNGREEPTVVRFDNGDFLLAHTGSETTRHPADSLVEPQGFPLATYLVPGDQLDQHDVLTPSNSGIRLYRYTLSGEEDLMMNGQRYQTRKWLKQRPGRSNRGFIIWSDKGTGIPIRIENFRSKGSIIMELVSNPLQATNRGLANDIEESYRGHENG